MYVVISAQQYAASGMLFYFWKHWTHEMRNERSPARGE
jgi:hypothetical protein